MSTIFKFVMICFNSFFLTLRAAIINERTTCYVYIVNCYGSMPFYCKNTHRQTDGKLFTLNLRSYCTQETILKSTSRELQGTLLLLDTIILFVKTTVKSWFRNQETFHKWISLETPSPATEAPGLAQISIQYIVSRTRSKSRQLASVTFPLPPSTSSVALRAN